MLKTPAGRIYFAGDSGYFGGFREIGARLGPFDLALIPIGAYEPRWFMEPVHCSPAEAVQIHRDVQARHSLAMHFGCFPLADDGLEQPVNDLFAARQVAKPSESDFAVPEAGETRHYFGSVST
jgi:L-ascorbate metabolism protein UlaG (beta-lactamase superfamily)